MRKIKIFQIGGNTQKNGITTFLLNIYKLMRDDYSFVFINTAFRESDPEISETIKEYGGKIYHLPYSKNTCDIENELKNIISIERPDVIHSHYFFSNGDFMRIGHETDIPVRIAHCHNDKSKYISDEEKQILLHSRELTEKYSTVKLALSENAGNFFYGNKEFEICRASIDYDKFYPIADKAALLKKHNLDENFKYSVFTGRFSFQKNVRFLIDIINELPDRKLILVGEGKEKEDFIKIINDKNIHDRFIFKTDSNLNEYYNIADSLLLPSFYEGLGLVLVEAQCAGTMCFASDTISREADLGMVEFLPLNPKTWADRLKDFKRKEPVTADASKFSANVIVNNLKNFYSLGKNPGDAYINLAKEYMLGSTERYASKKRALANFEKAYELGNKRGTFYYALQFFEGTGTDKNIQYAESLIKSIIPDIENSASKGAADYILILADMYSFGLGKPQSYELAVKYYLEAANLGNTEAMCDLGYMYSAGQGVKKNLRKSFFWYKKSADSGYLHSMRDVGQCYFFGLGTNTDYKKAINWFEKASMRNYAHATGDLALCYLKGHGVKKDFHRAAEIYLLAYKQEQARTVRDLIANSIDVRELLQNGKIKLIKRDKIDIIDDNVFIDNTIVINTEIKSIDPSFFYDKTDIVKFFVEKDNKYYKAYGSVLYSKDGETLIRFPPGSPMTSFVLPGHVKHIGAHAFQNCRKLQKIKLHENTETIGKSAFDDCKAMSEIKLPLSLRSVGAWSFHGCDAIEELFLPAKLTDIGHYAFGSCEKLKNFTVDADNPAYTSKDGNLYSKDLSVLFQYAIGKKEKLFALPSETRTIAFRAFSDSYSLEYIDARSAVIIEEKAFYCCYNLKEILLDNCKLTWNNSFERTDKDFKTLQKKRGRIILAGDIHGHLRLDFLAGKLNEIKPRAEDVVIILGDAGIVWQIPMRDDIKCFYSSLPCDVLFLDGNHENFSLLNDLEITERYGDKTHKVLPNVFHLMRGGVYLINGKKCFVFGGAYSLKRETNSSPIQVWDEELPNEKEYNAGLASLAENENKFDIILTHQAPRSFLDKIGYDYAAAETELLNYLEKINETAVFEHWYFGHIHDDIRKNKLTALFNNCEVIE